MDLQVVSEIRPFIYVLLSNLMAFCSRITNVLPQKLSLVPSIIWYPETIQIINMQQGWEEASYVCTHCIQGSGVKSTWK